MHAKTKKKKILILTYGSFNHSSSRIRALQFVPFFKNDDYKISVQARVPSLPDNHQKLMFLLLKRFFLLKRIFLITFACYDLVFIQRWFLPKFLIWILRIRNIPFIYDFDDAIYINTDKEKKNEIHTVAMIKHASCVIVSSPVLASFCGHYGVKCCIIFSSVNCQVIEPKTDYSSPDTFMIGWIGSSYTTPFLELIKIPIKRIALHFKIKLLLIGADESFNIDGIPIERVPWSLNVENTILKKMDVGVMPLPDTEWAKGKGGYKLFLYMAAGVPIVASPVGINKEIIIPGVNGYLASTEDDWVEFLSLILNDDKIRERLGNSCKLIAKERYDISTAYSGIHDCVEEILG